MGKLPGITLILSVFVLLTGMMSLFDTDNKEHSEEYLLQALSGTEKRSTRDDMINGQGLGIRPHATQDPDSATESVVQVSYIGESTYCSPVLGAASYVLDFTDGGSIHANEISQQAGTSADDVHMERSISIAPGTYRVESVSYVTKQVDEITPRAFERQQRWHGVIFDGDGVRVAETGITRGASPGEIVHEIIADSVVLTGGRYTFVVHHSMYPSDGLSAVTPLCVAFVGINDVEGGGVGTPVEFQ